MSTPAPYIYTLEQRKRHAALVRFFNRRGWMNCSHKSFERLEIEFAACAGDRPGDVAAAQPTFAETK